MFLESLRITARKKDYKQDSERDVLLETTVPDTKTTEQSFFFKEQCRIFNSDNFMLPATLLNSSL